MRLFKLTDENGQTYGGCQWGVGVTHTASGDGPLCSDAWIHAYTDPLLAALLNPIHAGFRSPRLWEAEGVVGADDCGLKVGCAKLTTLREIQVPEMSTAQRVAFAIHCAKGVYSDAAWNRWADRWLSGEDRTAESAVHAADAAKTRGRALDLPALAKKALESGAEKNQ